jgi:hypothetical protein
MASAQKSVCNAQSQYNIDDTLLVSADLRLSESEKAIVSTVSKRTNATAAAMQLA